MGAAGHLDLEAVKDLKQSGLHVASKAKRAFLHVDGIRP